MFRYLDVNIRFCYFNQTKHTGSINIRMNRHIEKERKELTGIIQQILDEAKRQGATTAEADIGTGAGLTVTTRLGEVEKSRTRT